MAEQTTAPEPATEAKYKPDHLGNAKALTEINEILMKLHRSDARRVLSMLRPLYAE